MTNPENDGAHWDFYPAQVDDAPASIFVDLALVDRIPLDGLDTLYAIAVDMLDAAEHGMGGDSEAEALWPIEDRILTAAADTGLHYIGRLRNRGVWQLTFMGPAGNEAALGQIATDALAAGDPPHRHHRAFSRPDPDWSYYRDFLFPDRERMQWILDNRVVDRLAAHGDPLIAARDVRHWILFDDAADRDGFAAACAADGFQCERPPADEVGQYAAVAIRRDHVDLESIHAVVVELIGLADTWRGTYDGWETSVEAEAPPQH